MTNVKTDLCNAFWLLIVLAVLAQSCGQAPGNASPAAQVVVTGPNQVAISVFNAGTQDPAFGTSYTFTSSVDTAVPNVLLRTQGNTDQSGLAVGVDFGVGQCYYNGDKNTPSVFTLSACTNGLVSGSLLSYTSGQTITLWSYVHVNSNDSIVELLLQGETK